MNLRAPSPSPVSLGTGDLMVVVWPHLGGRVHSLRWRGTELLRTPDDPIDAITDPWFWSGFYMAPWCGRLPGGRARACGEDVAVPVNFPDGSAIHGQVHRRPWSIDSRSHDERSLALSVDVTPPEYPWAYRVTAQVEVGPADLTLVLTLANRANSEMPAGLGWHPWFRADSQLRIEAGTPMRYPRRGAHDAADRPEPATSAFVLDSSDELSWGTHEVLAGGRPWVQLGWPALQASMRMSIDTATPHLVIYADARTRSVAVEPQTHSLDGFRRLRDSLPGALAVLEPGEESSLTVTMSFA